MRKVRSINLTINTAGEATMRYHILACDYDGTIAHDGHVSKETVAAFEQLLASGRKLVLVTGRELDELLEIFPQLNLFEWVVAENGALLYRPSNHEIKVLTDPPVEAFVQALHARGVAPMSVGRSIVATWAPHHMTVLDTIRELGLELQVIFNKGAVMVLPTGVNKAFGLRAALKEMGLSAHETVGVGDAENDHAFLSFCECAVAVANALPALKERADIVTEGDHGIGVSELIGHMIADDLASFEPRLTRHDLLVGTDTFGHELSVPAYGAGVLIAGPSGSGKSTTTTSLLERLLEHGYQFCVIDPEGDYESLEFAIAVGTGERGPSAEEVLHVLAQPDQNVVVNLIGLRLADRPAFFSKLLPQLLEYRERTGRPHWLVIDEAHHLLPPTWEPGSTSFAVDLQRAIFVTVHPDEVHPAVLASVGTVIAVGKGPEETFRLFCQTQKEACPEGTDVELESGEVLVWPRWEADPPCRVRISPTRTERQRHSRKYSEGELPPERSFYFRGPEGKMKLRAQNLIVFMQMADGVDDETWTFHLREADVSEWFRLCIKDDALADAAAAIEGDTKLSPAESRELIRKAVELRYTLPAKALKEEPAVPV